MTSPSDSTLMKGKAVLVTGATGGIGKAVVRRCVDAGAQVFCAGRDAAQLSQLETEFKSRISTFQYDVTDEDAVKNVFREMKQQLTTTDTVFAGLVNCAGVMEESGLAFTDSASLHRQMSVNFIAPYQHMQLASRLMTRNKAGSIVNVVSQVGEQGSAGMSAYAASKAALTGATKSLAKELAPLGIRINAVAPGFIDSSLTQHYEDDARDAVLSRIALKREGTTKEVADAVFYLLSPQARYTTGHILAVDGLFCP